jgi:hypothetical protein
MSAAPLPLEIDVERIKALPPEQQVELLPQIERVREAMASNPLWRMRPHEGELEWKRENGLPLTGSESRGQVEFLELTKRGVFIGAVVAGNRFGKTHIAVTDALVQTLPWELIPPWLAPFKVLDPAKRDVRVRFVGPDLPNWMQKVLVPKMRLLIPPSALHKGAFDKAWRDRDRILRFSDGSWWDVLTHDMELDAFGGTDVDRVNFDEEPTGELGRRQFEESVGRIIDRDGDIRFTLTPVEGIGWVKDELTDDDDHPRRDDEVHVVIGDIDHNPWLSDTAKAKALKRWRNDPQALAARKSGVWMHREGLIFGEFKRSLETGAKTGGHLRHPRPLPRDASGAWTVPVFEAIDPGINRDHPFALTVAFLNNARTDVYGKDDVLEVFHALKLAELTVAQQAELIHESRLQFGYQPTFTVIDPAARNRNPETGRKLQDAFRNAGVYAVSGQNDRQLTYDAIRSRLVDHRYRVWQGDVDSLLGDEFVNYRWKRQRGHVEGAPRPEPVKRNDDLIDTQRYMMTRIPVWQGVREAAEEDDDPLRRMLRDSIRSLSGQARRSRRVGGVW